jgi:hypothetical protein
VVQFLPHAIETPLIVLLVLHPFEVAGRHAAGVRQNVGENFDAALVENRVGLRLDRSVRRFDDYRGLDPRRVRLRDDAAERGRDQ